ncbi:MAG: AraC family transcriptional regulator [Acidobacteriota bacterium]|jgi:3-methyladenine DNA glycosylase/8-oxoguanine DNA glycosylase|nr:AraC family transcriptional regulator [Acidobacteriota bacterium]
MPLDVPLPRGYRPEYPLRYFARDPESPSERVTGTTIAKAFVLDGKPRLLTIDLGKTAARCSVKLPRVIDRMLGLHCNPAPFERFVAANPRYAPLIAGRRGLRIPMTPTVFEGIVWAIVGQQVNLAFAYKLRRVVTELAGTPVGGLIAHPDAAAVAKLDYDDLTRRQFSRRKAEYLIDVARLIATGTLDVEGMPGAAPEEVYDELMAVRGFGEWTTNYVMMRSCGFLDCVPYGDSGLASGLRKFFALETRPTREDTEHLMKPFSPYRSLATFHLWMTI